MSMQAEYNYAKSGQWAEVHPFRCPCSGGWLHTDLDTWHECPTHYTGSPHPENDDEYDADDCDARWNARMALLKSPHD